MVSCFSATSSREMAGESGRQLDGEEMEGN
jgi:hypothetical protein